MAERKSDKNKRVSARRTRAASVENKEKKATSNKKPWIIGGIVLAVVVLFLAISLTVMFAGNRTVARSGLTVFGIDVGGKTQAEIVELLKAEDVFGDFAVTYTCEGQSVTVNAKDVSLALDAEKTAEAAVNRGRSNPFTAIASLFASKEITPVYSYDHFALSDISVELSEKCGGSLKQHEIKIEDDKIRVIAGAAGSGVDYNQMRKCFDEAISLGGGSYALELKSTKPAQVDIDELHAEICCEPSDAHYVIEGKEVIITPEIDGKYFDKTAAMRALSAFDEGSEDVFIDLTITPAKVKAEDINKTLFADVLGEYTTKYATSNRPRANNVELAGRFVDGTILLPGDEFSYNKIVGERTYERGFKAASVYENNKMVDGLGGGICQTSSTIYAAVLYADLEVTERHEHMLEVHYAPLGMDATVAYGSLDFRFKNNTSAPVKVVVKASGGIVKVQILGTNEHPGRKVEVTTERVSYSPYGTTIVNDATLEPGKQVEDGEGFNGAVVNTYKIITENGKQVSNKLLHKSVYRMVNRILRVGPEVVDPNAPADPNAPVDPNAPSTPSTDPSQPTGSTVVIEGDASSAQQIYDDLQIPDGI